MGGWVGGDVPADVNLDGVLANGGIRVSEERGEKIHAGRDSGTVLLGRWVGRGRRDGWNELL